VTARWRRQPCVRAHFVSRVHRTHTYILCSLGIFSLTFVVVVVVVSLSLVFLFYRVAPRGVIDSRPRSIDYDYQGRVGVIRDLLSGSDRYGIQLYSGSPHRDKNQTRF
jgi:hypothetical protein